MNGLDRRVIKLHFKSVFFSELSLIIFDLLFEFLKLFFSLIFEELFKGLFRRKDQIPCQLEFLEMA